MRTELAIPVPASVLTGLAGLAVAGLAGALAGCGSTSSESAAGVDAGSREEAAVVDASPAVDAAEDAPPLAPPDTWTWLDFPDSRCANGAPTGLGINVHPGSKQLFVFLQGGGACASADTCWVSPTATNIATGYDGAKFAAESKGLGLVMQRLALNPLKDATFVYVPYCTGDVHVGDHLATYTVAGVDRPTYHYGAHNFDLFTARLAAALPAPSRIWLAGVSAGGYGTFLNQAALTKAFGGVRVDLIDDSGPAIDDPMLGAAAAAQWGPRVPAACADCVGPTMLSAAFAYARATYPQTRYAYLGYQTDTVLPTFYGLAPAELATRVGVFVDGLAADPNARSFMAAGSGHVVVATSDTNTGIDALAFLTKMASDDPAWKSVKE